ncbi:MAG TPA: hypothetical protein VHD63_08540, partial [Ktedonobacteraceae bacterium]|nr:hypothetical protein [Ktedonobacteraceae bacterium]
REQRALEALSAKAIGVLELRGGIHRQAKRAEWGSIGEARKRRFGRLPEGNSSHASMTSSGFIHVPGIRSRIANDVGRKLLESQDRLMGERAKKRDIVGVEGLSVFSKHDGSILGDDGGSDAGAVAPEEFFLLFGRTVGLLLVGAALDAQPAIRITCQAGLLALVLL